ncbi:MAG: hypothetical protein KF683_08250 [Rubrivivax sp.]|nr:hypothetical protein [Rubrivivax sp.]
MHRWISIECDYRTGQFTLRELAERHGRSASQICRRARLEGWTQDLREVVRDATRNELVRDLVGQVATAAQQDTTQVVAVAAQGAAQVIRRHRRDVETARGVVEGLLDDLLSAEYAGLASPAPSDDQARCGSVGKRSDIGSGVRHRTQLGERVVIAQRVVDCMAKLHLLERKAYGVTDDHCGTGQPRTLSDVERAARVLALLGRARAARAQETSDRTGPEVIAL